MARRSSKGPTRLNCEVRVLKAKCRHHAPIRKMPLAPGHIYEFAPANDSGSVARLHLYPT